MRSFLIDLLVLVVIFTFGMVVGRATNACPTDEGRLNRFSDEYNNYVKKLQAGVVDLKQWEKVRKAWGGLE